MTTGDRYAAISARAVRATACSIAVIVTTTGCFGYRVIRPDEIDVPTYEARPVVVPERCDTLVARAAAAGVEGMRPPEVDMIAFCQNQQILRAQEEEAAARKLEAHAEAASFALRLTTVIVGGLIAILAWAF